MCAKIENKNFDYHPPLISYIADCKGTRGPQNINFCELGAHAKFQNPRTTPSGRKVIKREKKMKRPQRSVYNALAAHALHLDQFYTPTSRNCYIHNQTVIMLHTLSLNWRNFYKIKTCKKTNKIHKDHILLYTVSVKHNRLFVLLSF